VYDTYITPNRGDALSMLGIARDAAALLPCALVPPEAPPSPETADPARFSVELADPDLCPRYVGLLVQDVDIGPSPGWLVNKIEAAGIRSINNIVDVTNFVLLELGQPLHAFDFDEILGSQIIVRRAAPGEVLTLIDHTDKTLDGDELVIADATEAIALAGVMGGLRSEISDASVNILIESAHFSPGCIRRTAAKLGVSTEASFRFERTVDPGGCARAALRAAQLMAEVAGGEIVGPLVDAIGDESVVQPTRVELRPERVELVLGIEIDRAAIAEDLRRLTLDVSDSGDGPLAVDVPTYRPDLRIEEDLIEEIARIEGYDSIPLRFPKVPVVVGGWTDDRARVEEIRSALTGSGLDELQTQSIVDPAGLDRLGLTEEDPRRSMMALENPLAGELSAMRTQLLTPLLNVAARNHRQRVAALAGFEIGRVYRPGEDGSPVETRSLGIVAYGSSYGSHWNLPDDTTQADFFRLKAAIENGLSKVTAEPIEFESAVAPPFDPACCGAVSIDGKPLGHAGRVSSEVAEAFGVPEETYLADLDIEALVAEARARRVYSPLPRFPAVLRDMAVVVDRSIPARRLIEIIEAAAGPLLRRVELFDMYEGKGVPQGKRSLALSLEFRVAERTLTSEEADEAFDKAVAALAKELGAELRS
jgi:phenylalanyl-tRNA synthetase beta chain